MPRKRDSLLRAMTPRVSDLLAVLARPLLFLIYWLGGFVPRDRRLWLFGSWSGRRYADNAAALFEYVSALPDDSITPLWITRERDIAAALSARGLPVCLAWSPRGIWSSLRGGVYIYDGLTRDINHWLSRGAKRVLLRHGVGIKRIERCIEQPHHRLYQLFHGNILQRLFWGFAIPWHLAKPDYALATSPAHLHQGAECYGMQPDQFVITGFPRNDQILAPQPPDDDDVDLRWLAEQAALQQPVILYLPTFRDNQAHFLLGWQELNEIGVRLGIKFMVKLHYVDAERGLGADAASLSNLYLADAYADANRLFGAADAMIGDYSSAVYDFMLTGKPVLFFIPDETQFLEFSRSLYYDYASVTPGPKLRSFPELEASLAQLHELAESEWAEHYRQVLERFHSYRDALASQRAYRAIHTQFLPDRPDALLTLATKEVDS